MLRNPDKIFLTRLYVTATIIFLVLLIGALSVRLTLLRETGERSAIEHFNIVHMEVTRTFVENSGKISDQFRDGVAKLHGEKGLSAILLRSPQMVYYAYSIKQDLVQPVGEIPKRLVAPSLHLSLTSTIVGEDEISVSAVYRLITQESIFRMIRDTLFLVLTFKLVCAISLLLIVILTRRTIETEDYSPKIIRERTNDSLSKITSINSLQKQGLASQEQLFDRLGSELQHALLYNTQLSLVLGRFLSLEGDTRDNSVKIGDAINELVILPDLAYCYGDNSFALVRPGNNLDMTLVQIEQWWKKMVESGLYFGVGISDRNSRQVDLNTLVIEAEQALSRAIETTGTNVVAFRADAERFQMLQNVRKQ